MGARYVLQYDPWGFFFSQLDASGSGRNNCGPASLCCAAMAAGTVSRNRSWQDLTDEACWNTRGEPNTPYNDYVSYGELERGLASWQIAWDFTYDFATAQSSPWSIVLCSGATIKLKDGASFYPDSWFGGDYSPNHFIVWLPQYNGSALWVMNPLYPEDSCVEVNLDSLRAGFGSAHLLRGLPTVAPAPAPPPEQLTAARFRCIREAGFNLKPEPRSGGPNVQYGFISFKEEGNDTGRRVNDEADPDTRWAYLQVGHDGHWAEGWTYGNKKYFERLT